MSGHGEYSRDPRRLAAEAKERRDDERTSTAAMRRAPARASLTWRCGSDRHGSCVMPWCDCPCHTEADAA